MLLPNFCEYLVTPQFFRKWCILSYVTESLIHDKTTMTTSKKHGSNAQYVQKMRICVKVEKSIVN
jgi:hypothetical protein